MFKVLQGKDWPEAPTETKNELEFQSATWSHYKRHNTVEFLVCVFPIQQ